MSVSSLMTCYSLQKKLLFIHVPKNAGTSIRANLNKAIPDMQDFDTIYTTWRKSNNVPRDQAYANHFPFWRIQELLKDTGENIPIEDMTSFMVMRNPWERMVSLYRHRLRKLDWDYENKARNTELDKKVARAGFVPWLLQTPHPGDAVLTRQSQLAWGFNLAGELCVDKIFTIENLKKHYPDFMGPMGITVPPLGVSNVGDGVSKDYRAQYNDAAVAHIEKFFKSDIEAFGYKF